MTDTDRLVLRDAQPSDCRFVWETNNHPSVREQSINSEPIPYENHIQWFESSLQRSDRFLLIAEDPTGPVGTLRFDVSADDNTATISIALTVASRGKGYGSKLIREGSVRLLQSENIERVFALIRPDNVASQKAFSRAGFKKIGDTTENNVALLRYEFTVGDEEESLSRHELSSKEVSLP